MKLTAPQRRELQYAANNQFGLTSRVAINRLGAASKRKMLARLCLLGLLKHYVHGGYEITDAGRAAITSANPT